MNGVMRKRKAFWIGGTLTGLMGVALARLVATGLEGHLATMALAAGFTLVIAGIAIIASAARREPSEAFVNTGNGTAVDDGRTP